MGMRIESKGKKKVRAAITASKATVRRSAVVHRLPMRLEYKTIPFKFNRRACESRYM
jgi:hypothetical protein